MPKPGISLMHAARLLCPLCSQGRRKGIGLLALEKQKRPASKANVSSLITTFRLQLGNSEKLQKSEAQTDPRRQKVVLRLIYKIVSDIREQSDVKVNRYSSSAPPSPTSVDASPN